MRYSTSPRRASEIPLRRGGEGPLPDSPALSLPCGFEIRLLRLAKAPSEPAREAGCTSEGRDCGVAFCEPPNVRKPSHSARPSRGRSPRFPQARGSIDAGTWPRGTPKAPFPSYDGLSAPIPGGAEHPDARLRRRGSQHRMDHGHHVPRDPGRLAVPSEQSHRSMRNPRFLITFRDGESPNRLMRRCFL